MARSFNLLAGTHLLTHECSVFIFKTFGKWNTLKRKKWQEQKYVRSVFYIYGVSWPCKGKAEHLYSALHTNHFKALRHGSHSFTCNCVTDKDRTCLAASTAARISCQWRWPGQEHIRAEDFQSNAVAPYRTPPHRGQRGPASPAAPARLPQDAGRQTVIAAASHWSTSSRPLEPGKRNRYLPPLSFQVEKQIALPFRRSTGTWKTTFPNHCRVLDTAGMQPRKSDQFWLSAM